MSCTNSWLGETQAFVLPEVLANTPSATNFIVLLLSFSINGHKKSPHLVIIKIKWVNICKMLKTEILAQSNLYRVYKINSCMAV